MKWLKLLSLTLISLLVVYISKMILPSGVLVFEEVSAAPELSFLTSELDSCSKEHTQSVVTKVFKYKSIDGFDLHVIAVVPDSSILSRGSRSELPAVAHFHRGGHAAGNPAILLNYGRRLASKGLAFFSFQYRIGLLHGEHEYRQKAVSDSFSAIKWLRKFSHKLGIDDHRLMLSGASAGAHMAIVAAQRLHEPSLSRFDSDSSGDLPKIERVVAYYPVVEFTAEYDGDFSPMKIASLMQRNQKTLATPLQIIQGSADEHEMIVGDFDGDGEADVPGRNPAESFCALVKEKLGGNCTVKILEDGEHNFMEQTEIVEDHFLMGLLSIEDQLSAFLKTPVTFTRDGYSDRVDREHCSQRSKLRGREVSAFREFICKKPIHHNTPWCCLRQETDSRLPRCAEFNDVN